MPVATSIVMDVVSFAWSRAVSPGAGASNPDLKLAGELPLMVGN